MKQISHDHHDGNLTPVIMHYHNHIYNCKVFMLSLINKFHSRPSKKKKPKPTTAKKGIKKNIRTYWIWKLKKKAFKINQVTSWLLLSLKNIFQRMKHNHYEKLGKRIDFKFDTINMTESGRHENLLNRAIARFSSVPKLVVEFQALDLTSLQLIDIIKQNYQFHLCTDTFGYITIHFPFHLSS